MNIHLPTIKSDSGVRIRSREEVLRRLVALWAAVDKAFLRSRSATASYISSNKMEPWLSNVERDFLFCVQAQEHESIHFSWQLEALYFVAWCAGLLECSEVPNDESSVESILDLFPSRSELPHRLRTAIRPRSKSEVLDRADLLYRLHWAVRDAELSGLGVVAGTNGGVVQEWHRAVNWMIRYDSEDDWDQVGTDT